MICFSTSLLGSYITDESFLPSEAIFIRYVFCFNLSCAFGAGAGLWGGWVGGWVLLTKIVFNSFSQSVHEGIPLSR